MKSNYWNPYLEGFTLILLLSLLVPLSLSLPSSKKEEKQKVSKDLKDSKPSNSLEAPLSPEKLEEKIRQNPALAVIMALFQFILPLLIAILCWIVVLWRWSDNKPFFDPPENPQSPILSPTWNLLDIFRVILLFVVLQTYLQWFLANYELPFPSVYVHLGATNLVGLLCLTLILWIWKIRDVRWSSFFTPPRKKDLWRALALYFMITPFLFLAALFSQIFGKWWKVPFESHPVVNMVYQGDPLLIFVLCFFAMIWAPLIEEIFFRAFLYPPLRQKMGKGLAMMAVSLLFAFLHPGFYSILPIFVLAMALVILFEKTQNIWPCVFLHFLNNSLTMVKVILLREFLG